MSAGLVVECCKGYISVYMYSAVCECHRTDASGTEYCNAKRHFRDEYHKIVGFKGHAGALSGPSALVSQQPEISE